LTATTPALGLRANAVQFTLLVIINAFVGAMFGLERTILPVLAEEKYHIVATTAVLSFIVVFGIVKAITNYWAGSLSDRIGRRRVLIAGWVVAVPVPFLLMAAPSWGWVLVANIFLGVSQGLTWSTTIIMKIDLVGPRQRGLAMGFNEFAGYLAVAGSAFLTGYIAEHYGLTPQPFYLGIGYTVAGLLLSVAFVSETIGHAHHEAGTSTVEAKSKPSQWKVFLDTTIRDRNLSTIVQAGFVNNLNDGMAWGLFPMMFAAAGIPLTSMGMLAAIYPATWGITQLYTGHLSDRIGRKGLIAGGMIVQAVGIGLVAVADGIGHFVIGNLLLGIGTAMVYPTLLAAIGDVAHPQWRASTVGVYRLWRDSGYAFGALLAGGIADAFGIHAAIWAVAGITVASGIVTLVRMDETLQR
jgi:MFS family permease